LTNPPGGDSIIFIMKYRDDSTKKRIIHRLLIAQGHLEKIISMVRSDAYCIDIVHQSIAVQAALKKFDEAVLENHLKTCVVDSIRSGKTNEVISEVMMVLEKKRL